MKINEFKDKLDNMLGDKHINISDTKERLVNFLKEDLQKLEKDIKMNNKENIDMFFSYWGQHFNKLKTK